MSRAGVTVLEPVALTVHLQDVEVVGELVQQGSRQPLGSAAAVVNRKCRF